ncbi:MAG TPA: hypothetical protein DCL77_11270 [Prolixibacteraceae bacterium]|jgi:hypothetical protein|nr:hypothetical protein [Prolixibacteraceae bacterium]
MNKIFLLLILTLQVLNLFAQTWPLPELPDTTNYGQYTSRTMHLLQSSTPEKPNTVKILIYGQSISVQDWWLEVKKSIQSRYPHANLIMENKAIGGFASQMLCKTVEMDVSTFYPDMVLLHIYGSNQLYDSVLYTIRSRTAAEVAIQTDHFTGENAWSDTMSYYFLPKMAEKYKCDLINIRDPWKKYLTDHQLQAKDLLKDEVHLNKYGEFLMAELIKPLFEYKSKYASDPFDLCTTMVEGKDFKIHKNQLVLPFSGNRVDVVFENKLIHVNAKVLLDGRRPSEFQGTYFMTRPYAANGKGWPWSLPAMIHIQHQTPWIAEEWTCKFTEATVPYEDFSFEISGSVTGKDGSGKASEDFVSTSKRVIISKGDAEKGGDWHLNRSYKVMKTIVNAGDEVKWKTYSISVDSIQNTGAPETENTGIVLFQGIPNTLHKLEIIAQDRLKLPIHEIKVYRPYYGRK